MAHVMALSPSPDQAPRLLRYGLLTVGLVSCHLGTEEMTLKFCSVIDDRYEIWATVDGWDFAISYAQREQEAVFGPDFLGIKLQSETRVVPFTNISREGLLVARHKAWQQLVADGCRVALFFLREEDHLVEAAWLEKQELIVMFSSRVRYYGKPRKDNGDFKAYTPLIDWQDGTAWTSVWNVHYPGHLSYNVAKAGQDVGAESLCVLYNGDIPEGRDVAESVSHAWRQRVGDARMLSMSRHDVYQDNNETQWSRVITEDCISSDFLCVYTGNTHTAAGLAHRWSTDFMKFLCKSAKVYKLLLFLDALSGAVAGFGDQLMDMLEAYVFDEKMWHPKMQRAGNKYFMFKSNEEFVEEFKKEFSQEPRNEHAIGANGAIIVLAGVHLAQSTETQAVNGAISRLSHSLQTFMGPVVWREHNLQGRDLLLVQLQPSKEGIRSIPVAPQKYARGKAIVPAPAWEDRFDGALRFCQRPETDLVFPASILTASLLLCCCGIIGIVRYFRRQGRKTMLGKQLRKTESVHGQIEMAAQELSHKVEKQASEATSKLHRAARLVKHISPSKPMKSERFLTLQRQRSRERASPRGVDHSNRRSRSPFSPSHSRRRESDTESW